MHFVIMGCGRVGARLATELDSAGHSVSVIDRDNEAFRRLPEEYSGQRVKGNGFDRATLKKAGINEAYAFAAVSNGDNSNIIAARTVREIFGVEQVVARIYDPDRAEVYERLGIPTVASVKRTAQAVLTRLLPPNAELAWAHPTGMASVISVRPDARWAGTSLAEIERLTQCRVAFVARLSGIVLAKEKLVIQEHDELYLAVLGHETIPVRDFLSHPPVR